MLHSVPLLVDMWGSQFLNVNSVSKWNAVVTNSGMGPQRYLCSSKYDVREFEWDFH